MKSQNKIRKFVLIISIIFIIYLFCILISPYFSFDLMLARGYGDPNPVRGFDIETMLEEGTATFLVFGIPLLLMVGFLVWLAVLLLRAFRYRRDQHGRR